MLFVIIPFALAILCFVLNVFTKRGRLTQDQADYFDQERRLWGKAQDAKTSKKVNEILSQMEYGYLTVGKDSPELFSSSYRENLKEIREYAKDLEREEWESKANGILDKFLQSYSLIIYPEFSEIEKAYKAKNRCIGYWQDYFASVPDGLYIYPKNYMKEYLGGDYDDCMESHESLERKLSQCIDNMKPEYKRKIELKKKMMDAVFEKGSIMRIQLLKANFEGCTEEEVKYCYKELVSKYKLVEVKIGSRYFVSLSDKEKEKRNK